MLRIATVPIGAELVNLRYNRVEVLHQGKDCVDENGRVFWKRQAPVLFPFVGKLKKNQTMINGRVLELNPDGFVQDLEFETVSKLDHFHSYLLKSDEETIKKFPFEFSFYVDYIIEDDKLTTKFRVINEGNNSMPFGLGASPAFMLDWSNEDFFLEFEEEENKLHFLYLVDGLIGVQYAANRLYDKKIIPITNNLFENDAVIMKTIKSHKIYLKQKGEKMPILSIDFTGFPYLSLWSKRNAPFLCISPWLTLPDKVNSSGNFVDKEGIVRIKPKEEFNIEYKIEFY